MMGFSITETLSAADLKNKTYSLIESSNKFGIDFYRTLLQQKTNLCFSPISLQITLATAYAGARGKTAEEMAKVLYVPKNSQSYHNAFLTLFKNLDTRQTAKSYQLFINNSMWVQKGYDLFPNYVSFVQKNYHSIIGTVDFTGNLEKACRTINDRVAKETNGKIREIANRNNTPALTRLSLVNTIYFNANWSYPFRRRETKSSPFYLLDGRKMRCQMMNKADAVLYYEDSCLQAIELPYSKDISMLIILPKKYDGLPQLEKTFSCETVARITDKLKLSDEGEIDIYLPKFSIKEDIDAKSSLQSLGIKNAFIPGKADFSGMTWRENLYIEVIHSAYIRVDERGTEAAAVTNMPIPTGCSDAVFKADHPFLFLIRDNQTGLILFIGRLLKPEMGKFEWRRWSIRNIFRKSGR